MNIIFGGFTYRVTTEVELIRLLVALDTLHAFGCGKAAA
jgi:hypothetical protein